MPAGIRFSRLLYEPAVLMYHEPVEPPYPESEAADATSDVHRLINNVLRERTHKEALWCCQRLRPACRADRHRYLAFLIEQPATVLQRDQLAVLAHKAEIHLVVL